MSSTYQQETPRLARLEFGSPTSVSSMDYELWSPGYRQTAKTDSVRRRKPQSNLSLHPTPNGPHIKYKLVKTPFNFTYTYGSGYYTKYIDWDPAYWAGCGFNGVEPNPDWSVKLYLAIKDQKVNLAQTLAEFGQAQKMFASNATTIAKTLSSLRRGDLKEVFRLLGIPRKQLRGTISNRWLELQYGWMPLLSDLHGAVEELQLGLARPRTRRVVVRVKEEESGDLVSPKIEPFGITPHMLWNASTTKKVIVYIKQESLLASRLGFTNPINLAWELLPYSFVIDWFIPIGNWLNALDAAVGLESGEVTGTVTTKVKYTAQNNFGPMLYQHEYYSRGIITSLPGSLPLPTYKPSLGWKQVANALALLSQLKR